MIGAGVAGLAAAIRLADFGHDVTVVERASEAGGQLRSLAPQTPSSPLITLPAVLRDLFRKTGRPLERCIDLAPASLAGRYLFADGIALDIPNASRAGTFEALDEGLAPGAGAQWDAVIRYGGAVWDELRAHLDRPLGRRDAWKLRRSRLLHATLSDVASRHLTHDHLTAMLASHATSVGADLATAPAALAALPYLEHTFGLWRVDGGAPALIEAMRTRAEEKGAAFRFGTPAGAIAVEDGTADGVTTSDGETIPADAVVATAYPGTLLPHDRGRPPPGPSVLSIATTLTADAPPMPERTIIADRPAIIVEALSDGRQVALNMPADRQPDDATGPQVDHMLRTAKAHGLPVEPTAQAVRTPQDLENATGAPDGHIYGDSWLRLGKVSAGTAPRIRGLYIAGAMTRPGPTIPFAVLSADIVSDLIGRA